MKKLVKLAQLVIACVLLAQWWERSGREFVLGGVLDEGGDGLDVLRDWVVVLPPSLLYTFTDTVVAKLPGMPILHDGEEVGVILEAERVGAGNARIRYEADRSKLGWPITVAVAQAELAVKTAAGNIAVKL